MKVRILKAEFPDGIEKASVSFWYIMEGDKIQKDQPLIEFVTEKTTFTYVAPCLCKVLKFLVNEGDEVVIGQEIAEVEME
ncbi:MAG: hypothetical protein N2115_00520 [bacterium]|nr:hypothetical protein [bacterium]